MLTDQGGSPPFFAEAEKAFHATDLRQVPLILTYGLYSGAGRAPLATGDARGEAYTRQIVSRQLRKGWEVVVLVFRIPASWTKGAEEPAGVGLDLVPSPPIPNPPKPLLEQLAAILPQGPGIVRAFMEWNQGGKLVWLPPSYLDRSATLEVNRALVQTHFLTASILARLEGILQRGA